MKKMKRVVTAMVAMIVVAASGKNLVVNGTFDSGELSSWTRNATTGRAGKQGKVAVFPAGNNSWVDGALGGKALVVQSFNSRDNIWLDSTDSYVQQSFNVDEPGRYSLTFNYAGRGHRDDKYWVRASCRVRVIQGGEVEGEVTLPDGVSGVFEWNGKAIPLKPGRQTIAKISP